jgi:hypothetical protein
MAGHERPGEVVSFASPMSHHDDSTAAAGHSRSNRPATDVPLPYACGSRRISRTNWCCGSESRTISGVWPGSACVAQPKHGS